MRLIVLTEEEDLADGVMVKNAVKNIETLGFQFDLVVVGGYSREERIMRALILGDYISVYVADARNIDPGDVSIITELKRRIRSND